MAMDENSEEEGTRRRVAVAPDGGYGWVILFASFIVNVLVDGVCFTFGIFYIEFLEYFNESASYTSWVGSVLNGMYLSMGPIVGALANRYGCRNVTIAGSVIACAAYILSTYSTNVTVLIITYGAMGGAGFGLMYLPAIVMVGFYFEKRRAFATGIAVCGSGIGAFVFAPLCELLLRHYSWKGSVLVIAAIVLNGVVMGALFRPLEFSLQEDTTPPPEGVIEVAFQQENELQNGHPPAASNGIPRSNDPAPDILNSTTVSVPPPPRRNIVKELRETSPSAHQMRSMHDLYHHQTAPNAAPNFRSMDDVSRLPRVARKRTTSQGHATHQRPLYRKDIFYSGSLFSIPDMVVGTTEPMRRRKLTIADDDDDALEKSAEDEEAGCGSRCRVFTYTFSKMMDFSLLKNPVFCVYGLSCFLCMAGFYVPFIYLPAHAEKNGMTRKQGAFLLSVIGIANTVARVLCGWISDQKWADCLLINNTALVIGGLATILSPFCTTYAMMVVYSCVFGMSIAVFVSLRSILMVELIGLDKLTNAFGLVTLCQGLSAFIGAPIAGAMFDLTGDYNMSFYAAGTMLGLAGLICYPLRFVARWHRRRLMQRQLATDSDERNSSYHKLVKVDATS